MKYLINLPDQVSRYLETEVIFILNTVSVCMDSNMLWIFCSFLKCLSGEKSHVITVFVELSFSLNICICPHKSINDLGESVL